MLTGKWWSDTQTVKEYLKHYIMLKEVDMVRMLNKSHLLKNRKILLVQASTIRLPLSTFCMILLISFTDTQKSLIFPEFCKILNFKDFSRLVGTLPVFDFSSKWKFEG